MVDRYSIVIPNAETMITNRGYEITERIDRGFIAEKKEDIILVIYPNNPKLNMDTFKNILAYMSSESITNALIIYNKAVTSTVNSPPDKNIQFMSYKDLTINKVDHFLVPKYELCTDNIPYKRNELPAITHDEAICRYYNFKKGDIIKIIKDKSIEYKIII